MGLEMCPQCGKMHYKTDKCPADLRKEASVWFNKGDARTASSYAMEAVKLEAELTAHEKRPVGRPKTITDMRAYKAEKARYYRARKAKLKAEREEK